MNAIVYLTSDSFHEIVAIVLQVTEENFIIDVCFRKVYKMCFTFEHLFVENLNYVFYSRKP